jgi:hypothetical protein
MSPRRSPRRAARVNAQVQSQAFPPRPITPMVTSPQAPSPSLPHPNASRHRALTAGQDVPGAPPAAHEPEDSHLGQSGPV